MQTQPIVYDITKAAIMELKDRYPVVASIQDNTQLKEVKAAIADVRSRRTAIEARRKELKADALEYGRQVDAKAKELTALLLEIEEPLKVVAEEYEERKRQEKLAKEREEKERIEKINALFRQFDNPLNPMSTQDEIQSFINEVGSVSMGDEWGERLDEALMRQRLVIQQAKAQLEQRKQFDEAQEILKREQERIAAEKVALSQARPDQTQSVSGFIDNQNEFWDDSIGISNVKNIVDAKKPSDKQIFNQALIDAAALLRRAQNQIASPAYKQSLGVFIDTLEEIELNSATA
ncbi:hypothetical protein [Thiomicrospira sp.]|uniref:hypothetical protein n=1 Tax=Thiomicrospira sp. TaxID=935 RepID=UPI002F954877